MSTFAKEDEVAIATIRTLVRAPSCDPLPGLYVRLAGDGAAALALWAGGTVSASRPRRLLVCSS